MVGIRLKGSLLIGLPLADEVCLIRAATLLYSQCWQSVRASEVAGESPGSAVCHNIIPLQPKSAFTGQF